MAVYSAIVSLKDDLELILTSYHSSPISAQTKVEFRKLYSPPVNLNSLLRAPSLCVSPIIDMAIAMEKDLEMLFRKEEFLRKQYNRIGVMELVLTDSTTNLYSLRRDVVKPMKEDITSEYQEIFDNINLLDALLTCDGNSHSQIRDVVLTIKLNIEKKLKSLFSYEYYLKLYDDVVLMDSMVRKSRFIVGLHCGAISTLATKLQNIVEPTIHKEFSKLYDSIRLMDSLLRDSSRETYDSAIMTKFQDRIIHEANNATGLIHFKHQQNILVDFEQHQSGIAVGISQLVHITDLSNVTQEISLINEELKRICAVREVTRISEHQNLEDTSSTTGKSARFNQPHKSHSKDGKLIGLEKNLLEMLDALTRGSSNLKILPVTGMAGVGKTTFANELYRHPLIMHHFDALAWATVTQDYGLRGLLLTLLSCIVNLSDEICESSIEQLCEKLYRSLGGKRYLVVLDDVWDKKVWDDVKRALPDDKNGSRLLLTTRLWEVAIYSSPQDPYCLQCLNPEESWELLCLKSFANGLCPPELLQIGKEIGRKCHGLPLAIVLVGGLLSKMTKTVTVWEEVVQNVAPLVIDDPQQHCQDILALSYNHLPDPLKSCLLYMGIFPEDYEISTRKLTSLWIAEGFVQPKTQKSLEEVAEDYLDDLISRCIILVKRKRSNGRIKTCGIHDLMRAFCLRESQKGKLFQVIQKYGEKAMGNELHIRKYHCELEEELYNQPRFAFYSNFSTFSKVGISLERARSFFCFEALRPIDLKECSYIFSKLLKVLDMTHLHLTSLPCGILLLIKLKYLALTIQRPMGNILSDLSRLQNLQVCNINGEFNGDLPGGFWSMAELRHFCLKRRTQLLSYNMRDYNSQSPSTVGPSSCNEESFVLKNLQSLSTVGPPSCTKMSFLRMPNLKKLGVYETVDDCQSEWFKNLVHLTQLETLKYAFSNPFIDSKNKLKCLPSWDMFPQNLKKLTLSGTSFPWEDMHQLSMLPKLEVLKLKNYAFSGAVWELRGSCFNCLKYLMIGSTNLKVWKANGSPFPSLVHLILRHCRSLEEIPRGVGESPLLEKIELHYCGESAVNSAMQLQEEQEESGNEWLKVFITKRITSDVIHLV